MAPENIVVGKKVDCRADVYALGIIFYEMITGRKPFTADTPMAVLIMQASGPVPRPRNFIPDLPDKVEKVLLKTIAKDPNDRYADMAAFAYAQQELLETLPATSWNKLPLKNYFSEKSKILNSKIASLILILIIVSCIYLAFYLYTNFSPY